MPVVNVMPLGRVLGVLLDRHASTEPGSATLLHYGGDSDGERVGIFWGSASVWRVEQSGGGSVCDGSRIQEWHGRRRRRPIPARPGWPDWHLQLVFPLRAHIWGRMGDDYYPASTREHPHGVQVDLTGREDDRIGHIVVDPEHGFIRQMSLLGGRTRLELTDLQVGPHPDAHLFRVDG